MKWSVRDFKAVRHAEIDISPGKRILLTGPNSSGKSSLIQSLLFTAQSSRDNNAIVLNGPLAQLGTAFETIRTDSDSSSISIAVTDTYSLPDLGEETPLTTTYTLETGPDNSTLRVTRLSIAKSDSPNWEIEFAREVSDTSNRSTIEHLFGDDDRLSVLHAKRVFESRRPTNLYLVMRGFQPQFAIETPSRKRAHEDYFRLAMAVLRRLRDPDSLRLRPNQLMPIDETVTLHRILVDARKSDTQLSEPVQLVADAEILGPRSARRTILQTLRNLSETQITELVDAAASGRSQQPFTATSLEHGPMYRMRSFTDDLLEGAFADRLHSTFAFVDEATKSLRTLTNAVNYLGPLRDDPRVVWNHWNEITPGLPLGAKGEHAAALLHRRRKDLIEFVTPDGLTANRDLEYAVNLWASHLEIGERIASDSHDKLGVGIQVMGMDERWHDLTSVGVGVSQALPILVALLALPPKSTFVVEQPELHLHPATQARLADFLLHARPDVCVIVETHSEALITRVRLHATKDPEVVSNTQLLFFERSGRHSETRGLSLRASGDLSAWPDGFFDQVAEDAAELIAHNLRNSKEGR